MLLNRKRGVASSVNSWKRLRKLFNLCSVMADADEVLCWHGVAALLAEYEGNFTQALHHRQIEIEKILWLQAEEVRNPTNGYQTQNYEESDLAFRREIVVAIENKLKLSR